MNFVGTRVEHCMGTVFSIDVREPGVDPATVQQVIEWLHHVDATFSTYRPESPISRLGRGEIDRADCSAEVTLILDRCDALQTWTGGYFSMYPAGRLDPSGLVKGWAIERASDLLSAAGSVNHCVNGGGDVQCAGEPQPGQPWRIGIAHPLQPGTLVDVVTGTDIAVATSGSAERGAHVIDPHTGRPPSGLVSLTVVGRRLSRVDAYATAAFAMGPRARDWITALPEYWGLAVESDGSTWRTPEWSAAHVG